MSNGNFNNMAFSVTSALFANYEDGVYDDPEYNATNPFEQSAIYQNNTTPFYAAQREADALMSLKQRRPMVFEYVKSLEKGKGGQLQPKWESITMYINPENMNVSTQKFKGKAVTRGGIYYHHWGDDHWSISLSGKTGFSGMKGIEVLERIYHNSGTLLRYQAGGPTLEFSTIEDPYKVISYNSVTELLETYMNFPSDELRGRIQRDIKQNTNIEFANIRSVATYEEELANRRDELTRISQNTALINSVSGSGLSKLTSFIEKIEQFKGYNEALSSAKAELVKRYDSELSSDKETKLNHLAIYNIAVEIVNKYFNNANNGSLNNVSRELEGKGTVKLLAAPEIISSIALKMAQDVIFLKDETKVMDASLLKTVSKYIEDVFNNNKQDIFSRLDQGGNSEYNILKAYELAKSEIQNQNQSLSVLQDIDFPKLERKLNLRDSVIETLKESEIDFFNQKSGEIQDYLDSLSEGEEGSIDSILYNSFEERKEAISNVLMELREWEIKEAERRTYLKVKAMETMDDMFKDEWAPRRIIMYFENRAYIGHFESFNYRRDAASPLMISYDLKFVAEKQILGTLY